MQSRLLRMAVSALVLVTPLSMGHAQAPGQARDLAVEEVRPQWQTGQRWVVETVSLQRQARRDVNALTKPRPVQWQFEVKGKEKVGDKNCYKVAVDFLNGKQAQPIATLWTDENSMMLVRIETQMPIQGQRRGVVEEYRAVAGRTSPVIAPLTAIPLDLPAFLPTQQKGPGTYSYDAIHPSKEKGAEDLPFRFEIEQEVAPLTPQNAKGMLAPSFAKSAGNKPALEVKLKSADRSVRQLWQEGLPWPAFADNGQTEARLVSVTTPNDR